MKGEGMLHERCTNAARHSCKIHIGCSNTCLYPSHGVLSTADIGRFMDVESQLIEKIETQ